MLGVVIAPLVEIEAADVEFAAVEDGDLVVMGARHQRRRRPLARDQRATRQVSQPANESRTAFELTLPVLGGHRVQPARPPVEISDQAGPYQETWQNADPRGMGGVQNVEFRVGGRDLLGPDEHPPRLPGRVVEFRLQNRVEVREGHVHRNALREHVYQKVEPVVADRAALFAAKLRFEVEDTKACPDLRLRFEKGAFECRKGLFRREEQTQIGKIGGFHRAVRGRLQHKCAIRLRRAQVTSATLTPPREFHLPARGEWAGEQSEWSGGRDRRAVRFPWKPRAESRKPS